MTRERVEIPGDSLLARVVREVGGERALEVFSILLSLKEATDREIAERADIKLNLVRSILNKLHSENFVIYRMERDEETGWLTCIWKVYPDGVVDYVNMRIRKIVGKAKKRLELEAKGEHLSCPLHKHVRLSYDKALECDFRCPICGRDLVSSGDREFAEALKKLLEVAVAANDELAGHQARA